MLNTTPLETTVPVGLVLAVSVTGIPEARFPPGALLLKTSAPGAAAPALIVTAVATDIDAVLFVSPLYTAMMEAEPVAVRPLVIKLAVPLTTLAEPRLTVPLKNVIVPVAPGALGMLAVRVTGLPAEVVWLETVRLTVPAVGDAVPPETVIAKLEDEEAVLKESAL